jgi:hypothetical protein
MGHEGVLELLDERVAACRSETERLRGEAERINSLLQLCEDELARLADAREVVAELPDAVRSSRRRPGRPHRRRSSRKADEQAPGPTGPCGAGHRLGELSGRG